MRGCVGKEERIDMLFREVLTTCPKYHMLLARIWEGIILEYWRSLGKCSSPPPVNSHQALSDRLGGGVFSFHGAVAVLRDSLPRV